ADVLDHAIVPGIERAPGEEVHARLVPPRVAGDIVEAIEQRLVHDRSPADDLRAEEADRRVGIELDPAAPVEERVAVDLLPRVGVAGEGAAGLEADAAHPGARQLAGDEGAG